MSKGSITNIFTFDQKQIIADVYYDVNTAIKTKYSDDYMT